MTKNEFKHKKIFYVKNFSFIIGLLVFLLILILKLPIPLIDSLEMKMMDIHFRWKTAYIGEKKQETVTQFEKNPRINSDIVIIGIDLKSMNEYGKWPYPRYHHADLINTFGRITNQNQRESALFLDIFFVDKDPQAFNDVVLLDSIKENERVFLETVLSFQTPVVGSEDEMIQRQLALFENCGEITNVKGDILSIDAYYSAEPPLLPFAENVYQYGHANFYADDDQVYRRQQLIAKYSVLLEEIYLQDLSVQYANNLNEFERLEWVDRNDRPHNIELPLTEKELDILITEIQTKSPGKQINEDGELKTYYVIRKYKDHFVPAITLSLAIEYLNSSPEEIEVVLGDYIKIPNPQQFNVQTGEWEPYSVYGETLDDLLIPINEKGELLINFMGKRSNPNRGSYQTYTIRSYVDYAEKAPSPDPETWPPTLGVANDLLMVGAFSQGQDEKTTPVGLMYGIEIHANALNTILMTNFIKEFPTWIDLLILLLVILIVSFYSSRMNTGWSLLITVLFVVAMLITINVLFDVNNILFEFVTPATGALFTFIAIVVYRVFMEESDKKRIKDMFGKYVSPVVVDQMMSKPPELGGVDSDITIFFSDIRSFTTLSESMTPQELVALLNEYLTAMTDTLISFNGTLDKYIGDAIMCFWGAPLSQDDHAELACKCALKQMQILDDLNEKWPESKRINIGIGLNSGISTVGNMGSQGRMNYTAMGDNVNLASRLEAINKQYQTQIIISEYTYEKIAGKGFIVREVDDIRVKGKRKPVLIYELVGHEQEITIPEKKEKKK